MSITSILFYSKYSQPCQMLMEKMKVSNVFANIIQPVCVDNNEIRDKIKNDENINIQLVPCVLIIYPDGIVEKFEGGNAFSWCDNIIEQMKPKESVHIPRAQPIQNKPKKRNKKSNQTRIEEIESETEEDSDTESEEEVVVKKRSKIKRPLKGIRTDKGNMEFSEEMFGTEEELESEITKHRAIKESTSSVKQGGSDVMNRMAEIIKEREIDDTKMPKRSMVPMDRPR